MSMYFEGKDGVQLYHKDWGSGDPVILIHGWPLSADSWDRVSIALVEAGFRVISYDRRGFGRSEQPYSGYDYNTLSDDLSALINAKNLEKVTLVGFSMGGGEIARYMSRHHGAKVSKAVLISSVVPFMLQTEDHPGGAPASVFGGMKEGILADRPNFFATFFEGFYGVGFISKPVSKAYLQYSKNVALQASLKATIDCVDAFGKTDFRQDLKHFKVPTLVIHGTSDETVPIEITGEPAAEGIEGAELIKYEGAPHGVFATHTDQVIEDLLRFLKAS